MDPFNGETLCEAFAKLVGKEQFLQLLIHLKLSSNFLVVVSPIWCTATWFKRFKCFWVIEEMMQCSCFSAQCQPVASSQSTFWNPSLHQCYPLWWKVSAKKEKVILLDKLSHSINIRKQVPSIQLCTWGAPNPPLFYPQGVHSGLLRSHSKG